MIIFNKNIKKRLSILAQILFGISFFWYLCSSGLSRGPRTIKPFERSMKYCYVTQKLLRDEIEMYNLDHDNKIENALTEEEFEKYFNLLKEENHIKWHLIKHKDSKCEYDFIDMAGSGDVFCKWHGSLNSESSDHIEFPELKLNFNDPLYNKYNEIVLKAQKNKKLRDLFDKIETKLIEEPIIPILSVLIFTLYLIYLILFSKRNNDQPLQNDNSNFIEIQKD